MLTKSDIRKKVSGITYQRGMDIYRLNKIETITYQTGADLDMISARVKGSGRNRYKVHIVYDVKRDIIDDIECECPAFAGYSSICKHCVAVLLEYVDHVDSQISIEELLRKEMKNKEVRKAMQGFQESKHSEKQLETKQPITKQSVAKPQLKKPITTPIMKQLLYNRQMKKTLPILQEETFGKVRIEPFIHLNEDGVQVDFKIGVSQMYILRDVFQFNSAMKSSENHAYGQKLQFLHTIEAFEPDDRKIVQFICNWAEKNSKYYMKPTYYGYSYSPSYTQTKLKTIPLGRESLEDFLDSIEKKRIKVAGASVGGEKVFHFTEEELPRQLEIQKKPDGIEVRINDMEGHQGVHNFIYFYNEKIYRVPKANVAGILDFLQCMVRVPERKFYIQNEDVPAFCRELLPTLEEVYDIKKKGFDEKDYGITPLQLEIYLDAPQKDFITCKALAVYGEKKYNIYGDKQDIHLRDVVKEIEAGKVISSFCNAFDEKEQVMVIANDEEQIYELLVDGISKMQELGEVFISDAMKRLNATSSPKIEVGVSISGDLLELSMTSEGMSKEQLIEILTKYDKKKKFYRLKSGTFVNLEDEDMKALIELKQGLNLSESQLKQSKITVPKYRALYLDAELKTRQSLLARKDKGFKALVRNMKTVEDNDFDIPDSLLPILREYQKRGFLWIKTLKHNGFGGILADDMGLGKSLQVICFLLSEYLESNHKENRKALIVCPSSLVYNWNNEIQKFAPDLPVKMVIGTTSERQNMLQNLEEGDILITSYDLLKRDISYYETIEFYTEIIDEAQYIKNSNTQAAKAVKMINAGFKLALTGTPIENRLSELWSIFDYLMPGFLYSYQRFREEIEVPVVTNQEETIVNRLRKMITPFVLRRLKKEVLTDLPDKLEESIFAQLEGEQQQIYDAHIKRLQIMLDKSSEEDFNNSKIQILSELTKLRQICCDPALLYENYSQGSTKIDMCMELIQNAISGGHKILLFSQFTSLLENLQKRLEKEHISFYTLTGATSKEKRAKMVEQFNKNDISVFCISLKAGGTGLNLTAADIVIHFDPWWNVAVQNQATDRAHRIGQKNVVNVYKLIAKGTIEENIMKIQEKKKELADQVLSGEGMNVGSFTREELLELLK